MRQSVCFVTETGRVERPILDPSVRYRCYHPAEVLAGAGCLVTVCSAARFYAAPALDHDVYVFHRPNASRPGFERAIDVLARRGASLVADYDDLVFGDEARALDSSAVRNGTMTADQAVAAFRASLDALGRFDRVSASTAPLAEAAAAANPAAQVAVVSNEIPPSVMDIHLEAGTPRRRRPPRRIGYFAGTRSHDHDLALVHHVLHRVLMEDPRRSLVVVGPVQVPDFLLELPSVERAPVTDFLRLPATMAGCDTVIAPLEDTGFNACKSRVKYLEAALAGCRLIATPIPDMAAVGADRITFARDEDDWYEALSADRTAADRDALAERHLAYLAAQPRFEALRHLAGIEAADDAAPAGKRRGLRLVAEA